MTPIDIQKLIATAEGGDAAAQNDLGVVYFDSAPLYFQSAQAQSDVNEALKWFRLSAAQGYPPAQYHLACAALEGPKGLLDVKEGVRYLDAAARNGHLKAQYHLGRLLWTGRARTPDFSDALSWLLKAARGGFRDAQYTIDQIIALSVLPPNKRPRAYFMRGW
jgi:TPR repeat protein